MDEITVSEECREKAPILTVGDDGFFADPEIIGSWLLPVSNAGHNEK